MRTSLQGIAKKIYAEASVAEEPGAEKLHAGICAGGRRAIGVPTAIPAERDFEGSTSK